MWWQGMGDVPGRGVGPAGEPRDATATVVGLARTLRAAGVSAGTDRVLEAVRALVVLDVALREDVYWAGRLAFCSDHEDIARYDRVFTAYFDGAEGRPRLRPAQPGTPRLGLLPVDRSEPGEDGDEGALGIGASASSTEVLRHRDIASLGPAEREELARILAAFPLTGALRRTRRWEASHRGRVDPGRTVQALLRSGGEPARLHRRTHRRRPRRVVLLVDVSGSMGAYADALLRFAHAATRLHHTPTEVFTVGTRLTRVTRELAARDPDTAMAGVSGAVPDWRGGTRLGVLLKEFCDRWGQRGMARGAVVVILSDGWERGDATLLGEQMARLGRLAHRVVWANPHRARPGYEPLAAGMAAALPHVDDFVAGHSLAALEELARVVAASSMPVAGHATAGHRGVEGKERAHA
jgi:uncharacterized protein